jgi:hypothetical protein
MRFHEGFGVAVFAAIGAVGCSSDNLTGSGTGGGSLAGSGGANSTGASGSSSSTGSGSSGSASGGSNVSGNGGGSSSGGSGGGSSGQGAGGTAGTAAGGAGGGGAGGGGASGDGGVDPHPLLAVLPKFTAPDVPVRGPNEAPPNPRNFTGTVPMRPGNGIGQHPMLYVGENYNRILMTNEGKVIWTYDTQGGFELDDIWLLSNGNVLYSHMTYIEEITPTKQVVWHYDPPAGSEIHTCQPIGLDKVVIGMNQAPAPKIMIINTTTKAIEVEHVMPDGADPGVHGQLRRMRLTANGTYLVAWIGKGKVIEYDKDFKTIWTFATPRPWSVARLHNGNTLIQDETESTCKEVNPQGTVVWSLKKSEISVPGAQLNGNNQTCERLATGNTVMFNHSPNPGNLQAVEVTQGKQVVWALEDYKNLGDATSAQFLDEPGIPEVPGGTEH